MKTKKNSPDQLKMGKTNTLVVKRLEDPGAYLADTAGSEVLLPGKFVPDQLQPEDELSVFVYTDSEDRPVATTQTPVAEVGDFAAFKVVDVSSVGAFLDWGLDKDLFLPFAEQQHPVKPGDTVVARVTLDHRSNRVVAVSKLEPFFSHNTHELSEQQRVHYLVYRYQDPGYRVVVNFKFQGIIYANESYRPLETGDSGMAYISAIRPDHKLDLRLFKNPAEAIDEAKRIIMIDLTRQGGSLPFSDKSEPETILNHFNMSKKTFKKAIGNLYREHKIKIFPECIELISSE